MRKLRIFEHMSLDGVIQLPDDDPSFTAGDWTAPFRSPAGLSEVLKAQGESFDLLLGRRTYDMWSGYWPKAPPSPMADQLNAATKFVVTHRPETLAWGPHKGVDSIEGIRALKAQSGPDLILWGSSTLTTKILELGLADEMRLMIYPVLLGAGKRFLALGSPARTLELVASKALASGILMNSYR